jgi:hypothetical protein
MASTAGERLEAIRASLTVVDEEIAKAHVGIGTVW